MTASASQFTGDIPSHYDAELGPNIFFDYARNVARRAAALKPRRVLELAAGTGIVSRELRNMLPANAALTVTDLNAPMLEVARSKFSAREKVQFEVADAMALPFEDGAFDLIVCQFGVMFFPDKPASFREARRVLAKGGRYLLSAWGTHADNAFARITHETVCEFFPENPPGFYRVPFSYADADVALADLQSAGFSGVAHEQVIQAKKIDNIDAFAHGLVFGNPLIDEIKARGGDADKLASTLVERFIGAWGEPATMGLLAHFYSATR